MKNNNGMPKFVLRKRDLTPLGVDVVSVGKVIVYYRTGSERQVDEAKTF